MLTCIIAFLNTFDADDADIPALSEKKIVTVPWLLQRACVKYRVGSNRLPKVPENCLPVSNATSGDCICVEFLLY